jgi:hypothetical protein
MKDKTGNIVNRLVSRLKKIGIEIELLSNIPWIYLYKVNGNIVNERFYGEHGFTIAFFPIKIDQEMSLTDIREIFKIIRQYKSNEEN